MKVALVVLSQFSTLKIKLFCVKYHRDLPRYFGCMYLGYASDTLQFICQLCRFHEAFILLEGFRYDLAWTA